MIDAIEGGFEERRVAGSVRLRVVVGERLIAEANRGYCKGIHLGREAFHPSFIIISNQLNYKQPCLYHLSESYHLRNNNKPSLRPLFLLKLSWNEGFNIVIMIST